MLNSNQKAFLTLCESIVNEASLLPAVIGNGMAAMALTKHIHSKMNMSHEAEVVPAENISLGDIKKYGGFYIIQGDVGYVALTGGRYGMQVSGVKKGKQEVTSATFSGVPDLRKFIKEYAGKIEKNWRSKSYRGAYSTADVKQKRDSLKTVNRAEVNVESLFERFKPLFIKAGEAAVADIRGVAVNMLKSGNYSDLETRIVRLKNLERAIAFLEKNKGKSNPDNYEDRYSLRSVQEIFKASLKQAIALTAHYYSGSEIDPTSNIEDNYDAAQKLFADIQNGDTKKLSTLLVYFKNGLVR